MDLLAPCRSCLQCLPFFHLSPPSPPPARLATAAPSSAPEATSTDLPPSTHENLQPSPTRAPAFQEQELGPPVKVEEQTAKCENDEALQKIEEETSAALDSEAVPPGSEIVITNPVSLPTSGLLPPEDAEDAEDDKASNPSLRVPFINDITFSASGLMPLQSPITPAPFGAGYPVGQYPPHDQIYQDEHLENSHSHSHHGHKNLQHGHEHSLHGHESSQHVYGNSHTHEHSHNAHDNTGNGHRLQHSHAHAAPDEDVPHGDRPSEDSQVIHELHEEVSHPHSVHHSHDSTIADDVETSVTGHAFLDEIEDIPQTGPLLDAFQSTPDMVLEANASTETSTDSHKYGAAALLETYHSEPVVQSVEPHDDDNEAPYELLGHRGSHPPARRRRRDHFKHQLKGIKQQIKQGGLHLKEEGSKHMQTIIENMNKQAQQLEQSGSFFIVPRANNN